MFRGCTVAKAVWLGAIGERASRVPRMPTFRHLALTVVIGSVLALVCASAGSWLNPYAIARWTIQDNAQDAPRAILALIGIRHLPIFLLAVALGNVLFLLIGNMSTATLVTACCPYLVYVLCTGIAEAMVAGESAWSWVSYEPAYFIWPHFVAVPLGLIAARNMVRRRLSAHHSRGGVV